jgi:hypothetical protein
MVKTVVALFHDVLIPVSVSVMFAVLVGTDTGVIIIPLAGATDDGDLDEDDCAEDAGAADDCADEPADDVCEEPGAAEDACEEPAEEPAEDELDVLTARYQRSADMPAPEIVASPSIS